MSAQPLEQPAGVAEVVATLVSPEGRADPYPWYEVIRSYGNIVQVKNDVMFAVGYEECSRALRENQLRVQDGEAYDSIYPDWREHSSLRGYIDSMLYTNEPDHARLRRLVSKGFTPARVAALRPSVERMTDRLLDRLEDEFGDGSTLDFIAEFAARLPIAVISALLGVPEEDQAWFRRMAEDQAIALEGISGSALAIGDAAMDQLSEYFLGIVDHHRKHPGDDTVSGLVQVHDTGQERLSTDELVGNMMLLLTAGFETTSFLLGHALLLALQNPWHAARLRDEPDFAAGYVEEVLRFESPVQATSRWAATDVEVLGHTVAAGTKLVVVLGAGNRDPRRYSHPERFDPTRTDVQPLSFGAGGHFCLGAPLSRMEAQIAMPRLLRRFPRIARAGEHARRDRWIARGLSELPITLT